MSSFELAADVGDFDELDDSDIEVWAGGGVVRDGEGRVLVVHRPRYDDWTLPKGKLDPGETLSQCAVREVHEETGFDCALGDPVAQTSYVDNKGRAKRVRYWDMTMVAGSFAPNPEVDAIEWLSFEDAVGRLTYEHDRALVESIT